MQIALILMLVFQAQSTGTDALNPGTLTGSTFDYRVQPGDTLFSVAARYGVDWRVLARENSLEDPDIVSPGQSLHIDNRHIVPRPLFRTGIVINIPQRMLFYFEDGRLARAWPVAVGQPEWPTPVGRFQILDREEAPTWFVPATIQEEMRRSGQTVVTAVPPGPDNPLGAYWLGLDVPGVGIHATNLPSSIYGFRTHSGVSLHPNDMRELYPLALEETPVQIIYERVLTARTANRQVFLEVHPDIYGSRISGPEAARRQIDELGLGTIDASALDAVFRETAGVARLVN